MSKVEVKETVGCKTTMTVEVEPERVDSKIQATLTQMKRDIQMPGFRRGKAPAELIMKRFGKEIRDEMIKNIIPEVLDEIFQEKNISPVGNPEIADFVYDESGPMKFTVSVEEVPEIDIAGFEGLAVTRETAEITEEDIDEYIHQIQESRAEVNEVDRPAQKNDILVVNLQHIDNSGVPILDKKLDEQVIPLDGKSAPSSEFEDQLIGMKRGERKQIRFTYDERTSIPDLKGTEDGYEVDVVKVLERIIPEMNDTFLKSLGDYTDIADFREKVRETIAANNEINAERKLRSDLVSEFVKKHPFDVPESMIQRLVEAELERMRQQYPDQGALYSRLREQVLQVVQNHLLVDAIKKKNSIEASAEDIDGRLEELATMNGTTARELRRELIKEGSFDSLKNDIVREKAYQWMKDVADITEVTFTPEKQSDKEAQ
ncbi:trigger factor [Candidatus Latescibacterota bacterium]